jgi:hypothetical protein
MTAERQTKDIKAFTNKNKTAPNITLNLYRRGVEPQRKPLALEAAQDIPERKRKV